jgi:hypothetical protein
MLSGDNESTAPLTDHFFRAGWRLGMSAIGDRHVGSPFFAVQEAVHGP